MAEREADQPEQGPEQLVLPGAPELFASVGVENAPPGLAALTTKQRAFVLEFIATGKATEAARKAGYSDPESMGTKCKKMPEVAAVLMQISRGMTRDAQALLKRMADRSVWLHNELIAERAKPVPNQKRQRELVEMLAKHDGVLANFFKSLDIRVEGEVQHTHSGKITVEQREELAQMQRGGVSLTVDPTFGGRC